MFDKLLDLLLQFLDDILPWTVIHYYEGGVRERLGKTKVYLPPGLHFKIPFVDKIHSHMVKTTTLPLNEQSITTKDWKSIVVVAVIKYEVSDVVTLLMEVNDPIDAISDLTKGIIRDTFIELEWKDCNSTDIANKITIKARSEAKKWGINIQKVTLTDLAEMKSFRLFNSQTYSVNE